MAFRIHNEIVFGELDNTIKGVVKGQVWLYGKSTPIVLDLAGNCCNDLAGCRLVFWNPYAELPGEHVPASMQRGECGTLTASRKVREPAARRDEAKRRGEPPFTWANALCLEWFSETDGRVIVESSRYFVRPTSPRWRLSTAEERAQEERGRLVQTGVADCAPNLFTEKTRQPPDAHETSVLGTNQDPVDRAIQRILHIDELKQRVSDATGEEAELFELDTPMPLDIQERFWENVAAFEEADLISRRHLLSNMGFDIWRYNAVDPQDLEFELWRLIFALASQDIFIYSTDHLTDTQLYKLLSEEVLDEETTHLAPGTGWRCHIDISEFDVPGVGCSSEIFERYYMDDIMRNEWSRDSETPPAPHEDPPFQRDELLPSGYERDRLGPGRLL